jgi:hypothetical protein
MSSETILNDLTGFLEQLAIHPADKLTLQRYALDYGQAMADEAKEEQVSNPQ